jgi:ribosome-associated translation inhibitor RaiA
VSAALTVSFLGIERSATVEARLRELGVRLRRHHDRISHCHITISKAACNASGVSVKIHVSVPGAQVHAEGEDATDAGIYLAAATAFESARRQLSDLQRDGRQYSLSSVVGRIGGKS